MLPPPTPSTMLASRPSASRWSVTTVNLSAIDAIRGASSPYGAHDRFMTYNGLQRLLPRLLRRDPTMASNHIFKIIFVNQGKVYEVYARKVSHGTLFGFVEIEELVFGERSGVVLDPGEERVKSEFAGVKRSYLPLQSIIRIDEVR